MEIHVEIWLAAASLHDKGRAVMTSRELQEEVSHLFGDDRPGVSVYISAHANASSPKGTYVVYNYLFRVGRGMNRLCRVTDPVHPSRTGSPLWPDQADVDARFWPLCNSDVVPVFAKRPGTDDCSLIASHTPIR